MERALLVEAFGSGREAVATELAAAGFEIALASDAEDALAALGEEPPDVIVCDHYAPRFDAIEFVRQVRTQSDVAVVVLTAFGSISAARPAPSLRGSSLPTNRRRSPAG